MQKAVHIIIIMGVIIAVLSRGDETESGSRCTAASRLLCCRMGIL